MEGKYEILDKGLTEKNTHACRPTCTFEWEKQLQL